LPAANVLEVAAQLLGVPRAAFEARRRNSDLRCIAARLLCRFAGLTQRDAAAVLGMKTGAAVGLQIRRLEARLTSEPRLRRRLADIESVLASEQHQ
jgi:hypothetical protein